MRARLVRAADRAAILDAVRSAIDGVAIVPLGIVRDARGAIMHMLRRDDPHFEQFGEIYFSWVNAGVVKGWHLHTRMTLNYAVPLGRVRLVLYDAREGSPTRGAVDELELGPDDAYALVRIPLGVWNAFLGLGSTPSLVANCATEPHDPDEIVRKPPRSPDIREASGSSGSPWGVQPSTRFPRTRSVQAAQGRRRESASQRSRRRSSPIHCGRQRPKPSSA